MQLDRLDGLAAPCGHVELEVADPLRAAGDAQVLRGAEVLVRLPLVGERVGARLGAGADGLRGRRQDKARLVRTFARPEPNEVAGVVLDTQVEHLAIDDAVGKEAACVERDDARVDVLPVDGGLLGRPRRPRDAALRPAAGGRLQDEAPAALDASQHELKLLDRLTHPGLDTEAKQRLRATLLRAQDGRRTVVPVRLRLVEPGVGDGRQLELAVVCKGLPVGARHETGDEDSQRQQHDEEQQAAGRSMCHGSPPNS